VTGGYTLAFARGSLQTLETALRDRDHGLASSYTAYGVNRFACVAARDRANCTNYHTLRGDDVEKAILRGLKTRPMDTSLFEEFAREFMMEVNRQRSTATSGKGRYSERPRAPD